MVYPALLQLMHTPRLPLVDWTDAPADLKGLVRLALRRSQVSARVPSHFNRPLLRLQNGYAPSGLNCNTIPKKLFNVHVFTNLTNPPVRALYEGGVI